MFLHMSINEYFNMVGPPLSEHLCATLFLKVFRYVSEFAQINEQAIKHTNVLVNQLRGWLIILHLQFAFFIHYTVI